MLKQVFISMFTNARILDNCTKLLCSIFNKMFNVNLEANSRNIEAKLRVFKCPYNINGTKMNLSCSFWCKNSV